MRFRRVLFAVLVVFASTVKAADLQSIKVDYKDGVYVMQSTVWFDTRVDQVYHIFRHWDYSSKFSSAIVEAKDLPADDQGRAQYYVRNRGCVLFFCSSFERYGTVEAIKDLEIHASADAAKSDFHISNESWTFVEKDGGTIVTYDLEMQPKFWIPPGIGPYMIKRKLRRSGGDAINRIEVLAKGVGGE